MADKGRVVAAAFLTIAAFMMIAAMMIPGLVDSPSSSPAVAGIALQPSGRE